MSEPNKWVLREVMFDDDGVPLAHREPVQAHEPVQFAEIAIGVLGDRNGFDNWWDDLDEDLQQEILEEIDSAIGEKAAPVQQEPTTSHSTKHSAGYAESFCNDEMESSGEYIHLCKGVLVTGVRGEVCNRCGKELI